MRDPVRPVKYSFFKHHVYTHISVDSSQLGSGRFPVLFLALSEYSTRQERSPGKMWILHALVTRYTRYTPLISLFYPQKVGEYTK